MRRFPPQDEPPSGSKVIKVPAAARAWVIKEEMLTGSLLPDALGDLGANIDAAAGTVSLPAPVGKVGDYLVKDAKGMVFIFTPEQFQRLFRPASTRIFPNCCSCPYNPTNRGDTNERPATADH